MNLRIVEYIYITMYMFYCLTLN